MNKPSMVHIQYLVLAALVIFTIALGINNYNSGVYADAHGLDGGKVGWFAPLGVPLMGLALLVTLGYTIYVISRTSKK
jgi:hypothetical protein